VSGRDYQLEAVQAELERLVPIDHTAFYGRLIRQATDEVLDGPRTGRWQYQAKTEKAYIGTRIEILLQDSLGVSRGQQMDLSIAGVDVDVKSGNRSCMFPTEALDHLCLLVLHSHDRGRFSIGLWRCCDLQLNSGRNKDGKRTMNADGRQAVTWIVDDGQLPPHHLARFTDAERQRLFDPTTGCAACCDVLVTRSLVECEPFPRDILETLGHSLDQGLVCLDERADLLGGRLLRGSLAEDRAQASRHGIALTDRHYLVIG
jgi:hypothetical protein